MLRPGVVVGVEVSSLTMVPVALEAAERLAADGIETNVLDLRWLSPLDEEAILSAVRQTGGKTVIVHEAVRTGGFAGEIAMRITEALPGSNLRMRRVTTPDTRIPASPVLQASLIPDANDIADTVRAVLG